jgi:hypothetical protein
MSGIIIWREHYKRTEVEFKKLSNEQLPWDAGILIGNTEKTLYLQFRMLELRGYCVICRNFDGSFIGGDGFTFFQMTSVTIFAEHRKLFDSMPMPSVASVRQQILKSGSTPALMAKKHALMKQWRTLGFHESMGKDLVYTFHAPQHHRTRKVYFKPACTQGERCDPKSQCA